MINTKGKVTSDYYLCAVFNDETEIFFGAFEKELPATIEKAVTGDYDIKDLFGGRREIGSFAIDYSNYDDSSRFLIENAAILYASIMHSIGLNKETETVKAFNDYSDNCKNAYGQLAIHTIWNLFRVDKHFSAGKRAFDITGKKEWKEYAESYREKYRRMLKITGKDQYRYDKTAVTVSAQNGYIVLYAKASYFEELYDEYITKLKKKKIYCRQCSGCGTYMLFYSKNKRYCDNCYFAQRKQSEIQNKMLSDSDDVLKKKRKFLNDCSSHRRSARYKKSTPEYRQHFDEFYERYKAEAKEIVKIYKAGKIDKEEAITRLKVGRNEYLRITG